jgi:hypothetical protein
MAEPRMLKQNPTASIKASTAAAALLSWPDIHVVEINRRGMVFRSHQAFDLGDALHLGVHLCFRPSASATAPQHASSDFLKIEGVVVDCRVVSWGAPEHVFEITLMFPSLDEDECALLVEASRQRKLDPPSAHHDPAYDEETAPGFDRIMGFN